MGHSDYYAIGKLEASEVTASVKVGFFDKATAPVEQQDGVSELTDSSTGTAGTTISAIGDTSTVNSGAAINNNFASVVKELNDLRAAMVAYGLLG